MVKVIIVFHSFLQREIIGSQTLGSKWSVNESKITYRALKKEGPEALTLTNPFQLSSYAGTLYKCVYQMKACEKCCGVVCPHGGKKYSI